MSQQEGQESGVKKTAESDRDIDKNQFPRSTAAAREILTFLDVVAPAVESAEAFRLLLADVATLEAAR